MELTKEQQTKVERMLKLVDQDPSTMAHVFDTALVAGMELAMRICRERARWEVKTGACTKGKPEGEICANLIRLNQVEIGAGRMPRPSFSKDEIDEMNRIE